MSLATHEDAGTKFWRMPELVEKLMEYLDEISILSIVGLKLLPVEVLQAASRNSKRFEPTPLRKLIRKVLGFEPQRTFEYQRFEVRRLSRTLLAHLDSEQPLLLEVLDVICAEHKYRAGGLEHESVPEKQLCDVAPEQAVIRLTCPLHTYHSVDHHGLILLEDCEGAISSTEQRIRKIEFSGYIWDIKNTRDFMETKYFGDRRNFGDIKVFRDNLFLALVSRVTRQLVPVETLAWHSWKLKVNNKDQVVSLNALLQRCHRLKFVRTVCVGGELETEGWEPFAKALQKHPCHAEVCSPKPRMLQARREDLRTIWETMPGRLNGNSSSWIVSGRRFNKASVEESEKAWIQMLEFLDG